MRKGKVDLENVGSRRLVRERERENMGIGVEMCGFQNHPIKLTGA